MSEGFVQDPYMAAGVEFEPVTLRTQGTELTTEPPCLNCSCGKNSGGQQYCKSMYVDLCDSLKLSSVFLKSVRLRSVAFYTQETKALFIINRIIMTQIVWLKSKIFRIMTLFSDEISKLCRIALFCMKFS